MKKMNLGVPRAVAAALMLSTLCLAAAPAQGQPLSSAADEEQRALRGFFSLGLCFFSYVMNKEKLNNFLFEENT